jgi:hypothetical protein
LWQERIFSVRSENWRLVWNEEGVEPKEMPEGSYPVPRLALYDVHRDPSELQDVAARHPETVERMKLDLERWRALQRPFRGERKAPDAERMRAMRELGYAGEEPR